MKKNYFTVEMLKSCNRFPREAVESPALKILNLHSDAKDAFSPEQCSAPDLTTEGLGQTISRAPFHPELFWNFYSKCIFIFSETEAFFAYPEYVSELSQRGQGRKGP